MYLYEENREKTYKMKNKIEAINGFRAVAFIVIFLSHAGVIWHDFGACSVSFFLVLSGFITFYAHQGECIQCRLGDCIKFSYRKIKRMYPLHLIMLVPALAIQVALVYIGREVFSIADFLSTLIPNVFLFHTWFPIHRIYFGYNGVAWYLSTYVFLCFMFPILFRLMKKWNTLKAAISIGICVVTPIVMSFILEVGNLQQYREWLLYVFPPVRLLDYFAGMQIGYFFCSRQKKMSSKMIVMLQGGVILASVLLTGFLNADYEISFIASVMSESIIVYMPVAILGVYLIAQNRGGVNRCLKSKWLSDIGNVSMYAFLIHYLVLQYTHMIITNFISENVSVYVLCVISMLITAGLTWFYIKVKNAWKVSGR